jgi:hypothetical protein
MAGGRLEKAYMYNEDMGTVAFTCLFNPTSYSFNKQNTWHSTPLTSTELPEPSFQGGGQMTMTFTIFFDTYGTEVDVRAYTEQLLNLMRINPLIVNPPPQSSTGQPSTPSTSSSSSGSSAATNRPPICSFHWGNSWSFKGVVTKVTLDFKLFTNQGIPVRAQANVTMTQVEQEGTYPGQNPTSGGLGTRASRLVQPGDTLDLIAFQVYGDSSLWRLLAQVNSLENPRVLRPGQRLVIP